MDEPVLWLLFSTARVCVSSKKLDENIKTIPFPAGWAVRFLFFLRVLLAAHHRQLLSPLLRQVDLNKPEQTRSMPPPSTCEKFYQVPLTEERIHLVDTPEVLSRCQNIVLKVC